MLYSLKSEVVRISGCECRAGKSHARCTGRGLVDDNVVHVSKARRKGFECFHPTEKRPVLGDIASI